MPLPDGLPTDLLDLLRRPSPCFLATLMPDGSPQMTQTWVDTDGTHVLVNTVDGHQKVRNVRRDPRVAVNVADPEDPSRYFEVQKFVANTGHFFDFINVVANRRAFEALPAAQQKTLRDSMAKAVAWQRSRAQAEENESVAEIKKRGMSYHEVSPQFREQLRKASAGVVEDVKKRVDAEFVNRVLAETSKK